MKRHEEPVQDHRGTFRKAVKARAKPQISPEKVVNKSKPRGRVSSNVTEEEPEAMHVSQSTRSSKTKAESVQQSQMDEYEALELLKRMFENLVLRHQKGVR